MYRDTDSLGWYRVLLKLYPRTYREEYEEEMLDTLASMFNEARNRSERIRLATRVVKDYCISLIRQNFYATESSFNDAPPHVKRQLSIGFGLMLPFLAAFMYNFVSLSFRHVVLLVNVESRTWIIYSVILPVFGLAITVTTCLGGVYR